MTYSTGGLEDYTSQGQQDDYFAEDLAIASHPPKSNPVPTDICSAILFQACP
ncbi:MAG: hypothetical protein KME12_26900 [Trichocoleus desertorum ATA4-8-CV12]|jgi:hypothetical protein|nr:hypothetical protein [Trichocoleus desertorum ATA4-8-CV12]